ncbi:hypothetical protein HYE16_00855 [Mycoplasmopsis bovis]|nr:hypothetical protein HYE11_00830 [Mycoplasmopsis bovis]QQH28427.1 hypothetical protein HYE01_00825 [Mycoplasmopsis bovis]QUE41099.1 hypothetical protein HYE38_00875 [Mycoplasmopsis bovis]QUE42021.1 hypothetical protein HYE16_00855 [Mycoplasmopsis bovis]
MFTKQAEYSNNFAKLFITLNNNELLDFVTVHPNYKFLCSSKWTQKC